MSHAADTKKKGGVNHSTSQTPALFAAGMLSQIK
jgi:hypothetical protein